MKQVANGSVSNGATAIGCRVVPNYSNLIGCRSSLFFRLLTVAVPAAARRCCWLPLAKDNEIRAFHLSFHADIVHRRWSVGHIVAMLRHFPLNRV